MKAAAATATVWNGTRFSLRCLRRVGAIASTVLKAVLAAGIPSAGVPSVVRHVFLLF